MMMIVYFVESGTEHITKVPFKDADAFRRCVRRMGMQGYDAVEVRYVRSLTGNSHYHVVMKHSGEERDGMCRFAKDRYTPGYQEVIDARLCTLNPKGVTMYYHGYSHTRSRILDSELISVEDLETLIEADKVLVRIIMANEDYYDYAKRAHLQLDSYLTRIGLVH